MIPMTTRSLITLADGTLTPSSTVPFFKSHFNSAATVRHHYSITITIIPTHR